MSEEVVTVERARRYAQRWFPMNAIDDGSPMIGETRLAHITLQLCAEIERLRAELAELRRTGCRSEKQRRIDAVYEDEYRVGGQDG